MLSELEKIEVAIRAQMIYTLSHNHGPFWFNEFSLFSDRNKLKSSRGKMLIEYNRSDEELLTFISSASINKGNLVISPIEVDT
ncbi:MAG: Abi family protein [Bacteroidales bacterium]